MKKFLMLIVLSYALVACENDLESVNNSIKHALRCKMRNRRKM